MRELKWVDHEHLKMLTLFAAASDFRVHVAHDGVTWEAICGRWQETGFPDAETAKSAVQAELIRRCRATLSDLEALHATC